MKTIPLYALIVWVCVSCASPSHESTSTLDKAPYSPELPKVKILKMGKRPFIQQLRSNGKLSASKKSELSFLSSGILIKQHFYNGDLVHQGDTIASIDDHHARLISLEAEHDLESASLRYWEATLNWTGRPSSVDSMEIPEDVWQRLRIISGLASAEIQIEMAREELRNCYLIAPYQGKISHLDLQCYEMAGGTYCTLIQDEEFSIRFYILESEYPMIRKGQTVQVESYLPSSPRIEGQITHIDPMVNENGQVAIEALIRNPGNWIDGMNVSITVENRIPDQWVVPKSAVVQRDKREVVFVYRNGKAFWTYVQTTLSNASEYALTFESESENPFHEGDSLIVSGNLNLGHESPVTLE